MTTQKQHDGGTAFPCQIMDFQPTTGEQVVREQFSGMSLRDWFAGQALAGYLSDVRVGDTTQPITIATWCYTQADTMLAAREPKGKTV